MLSGDRRQKVPQKGLTKPKNRVIIIKHQRSEHYAGMAELADARDLKSREIFFSYRFDPGFRHHIAGWSSLVARRAHNPEVVRFKSHPRNHRKALIHQVSRLFFCILSNLPNCRFFPFVSVFCRLFGRQMDVKNKNMTQNTKK